MCEKSMLFSQFYTTKQTAGQTSMREMHCSIEQKKKINSQTQSI